MEPDVHDLEEESMGQYDAFAMEYDQTVRRRTPVIECAYGYVLKQLGDISSKQICDLGCGQGELSRRISQLGASVTGVDYSSRLLELAESYESYLQIEWGSR